MSENEGKEPKELESEKILAQINAVKSGTPPAETTKVKSEENSKEPEPTQPEKATQPTVEKEPALQGKAEETTAPDDKKLGKPEVDIREWAKRKGFREGDQESVLKAYREMERKLSQVNAQMRDVPQGTQNVPRGTEPQYQPMPSWQPPQPAWQPQYPQGYQAYPPPPQTVDRRAIIEAEANRFGVTPEDLEKFLPIMNEVTEIKLSRERQMLQAKYDAQLADLTRGNKRNADFDEALANPLFTKPEVAFEIDQIISENPQRLKLEPTPWTNMLNDALARIGRKSLQGNSPVEENSSLPMTPPKNGGRGSSPTIPTSNTPGSLIEKFKDLDTKEMEKQLSSLGAIPPR